MYDVQLIAQRSVSMHSMLANTLGRGSGGMPPKNFCIIRAIDLRLKIRGIFDENE